MSKFNIQNLQTSSYGRCLRVTLLLLVMQLFAVSSTWGADGDKIIIPTLKIVPGTTQQLAIQLKNTDSYTAFQAEFYFPEGITPVMENGSYKVSLSSRKADHTISSNIVGDGGLKVVSFSMTNESIKGNSGDLFYIDIVSDPNFEGPATVEVKGILFTLTSNHQEIPFADASGVVDTHAGLKGDVNSDGEVNVGDIVTVSNVMAGKSTVDPQLADVNEDGEVNVGDIVTISNIMAGK